MSTQKNRHDNAGINLFVTTLLFCLILYQAGCASITKRQYFMAVEPEEGERALYRLDLEVTGWGAEQYKLTTGYVPANVIDALSGGLKEPKDLYSPQSRSEAQARHLDTIYEEFGKNLEQMATTNSGKPEDVQKLLRQYATLYSAAARNDADLISIGEMDSTNPYAYRKLVFFVSTKVINIEKFKSEVEAIERSAVSLAETYQQVRQARAAAAQARADKMNATRKSMLSYLQTNPQMTNWSGLNFLEFFGISQGLMP